MLTGIVNYSDADKVAADYERSEALGAAMLAGEEIEDVQVPGKAFTNCMRLARKVNLVTGEVRVYWAQGEE